MLAIIALAFAFPEKATVDAGIAKLCADNPICADAQRQGLRDLRFILSQEALTVEARQKIEQIIAHQTTDGVTDWAWAARVAQAGGPQSPFPKKPPVTRCRTVSNYYYGKYGGGGTVETICD